MGWTAVLAALPHDGFDVLLERVLLVRRSVEELRQRQQPAAPTEGQHSTSNGTQLSTSAALNNFRRLFRFFFQTRHISRMMCWRPMCWIRRHDRRPWIVWFMVAYAIEKNKVAGELGYDLCTIVLTIKHVFIPSHKKKKTRFPQFAWQFQTPIRFPAVKQGLIQK